MLGGIPANRRKYQPNAQYSEPIPEIDDNFQYGVITSEMVNRNG